RLRDLASSKDPERALSVARSALGIWRHPELLYIAAVSDPKATPEARLALLEEGLRGLPDHVESTPNELRHIANGLAWHSLEVALVLLGEWLGHPLDLDDDLLSALHEALVVAGRWREARSIERALSEKVSLRPFARELWGRLLSHANGRIRGLLFAGDEAGAR